LADEEIDGEPLLFKVMEKGKLLYKIPPLNEIQAYAKSNLAKLPAQYKALIDAPIYPVELSQKLIKLIDKVRRQIIENEINHTNTAGNI
jgi:nicotinate phosphoribosyltransferase